MDPLSKPDLGSPVQISEIDRDALGFDLGQERLLQLTKRTLDLALAFRVPSSTRNDLHPVMSPERDRWGVQLETTTLGPTECSHPIRSTRDRHTPGLLEEADHALESVMAVLRGREPPEAPTRPRQDHPEHDQRPSPAEAGRPR